MTVLACYVDPNRLYGPLGLTISIHGIHLWKSWHSFEVIIISPSQIHHRITWAKINSYYYCLMMNFWHTQISCTYWAMLLFIETYQQIIALATTCTSLCRFKISYDVSLLLTINFSWVPHYCWSTSCPHIMGAWFIGKIIRVPYLESLPLVMICL